MAVRENKILYRKAFKEDIGSELYIINDKNLYFK